MKMFLLSFNAFKHRSIFAVFLAIFLLFGAVKGTKAQESNGSAFDGLENLVGIPESDMKTYASEGKHGEFPTTDKNKIFFLYNVKTGLLLNAGGYWGTHVSLQEYGMPLWVYEDGDGWIHFQQDIDKQDGASENQEGCSLEYFYGEGYASASIGVFVDRNIYKSSTDKTVIQRGWTIVPIDGDAKNTFRIYTYRRSANGYSKYTTYDKYYLSAAASQGDVDKNCGAFLKTDNDYSDEGSQWRIFSYQQLYDLQTNSIGFKSSLDLSFKLVCPGFSRDNGALDKWKTAVYKNGATGLFRFGLEERYKTDPKHESYDHTGSVTSNKPYTFNGIKYTSMNDYQTHLGKYYCADIKNTRGAVYQVVHVEHGGSYVIECKAYSNTNKAKLFATLLQDKSENPTDYTKIVEGSLRETVVMQTANMSQTEQTNLHISDQNMDYAGKEFYGSHKYFNSVLVQVPEGGGNICFGVRVGSVEDNEAGTNEWTVFDDFRLLYAGSTTSRDLILDEAKDNLNYLLECTETYDDVVPHLNKKSFNKNKWNTIVLPVDLNKDQFTQAFGANARLAKLTTLTQNQIQFETVKMNDKKDNEAVLEAYVPYIIYPTKNLANERTPAYTATLHKIGAGSELEEHKVTIAKDHIDIPNVSLKKNDQNKNDLFGLIKETWSLDLNHVIVAGKTEPSEIVTDGTLAAYGTFARTFGDIMKNDEQTTFTISDKNNPIIEGRDNLQHCYFFHEGKMVYAGNKVRGLRGFSVWFKPYKNPTSGAATSKFILDGIDYTTDVERIMATEDSSINSKFAKLGVFNLNGQLVRSSSTDVSGLPSGIYIVNGKKVFVK